MKASVIPTSHLTRQCSKHLTAMISITSVALTLPVLAIERAAEADTGDKANRNTEGGAHSNAEGPLDGKKAGEKVKKKTAFLGLGGAPVSRTLSYHLNLQKGQGLTIFHVTPDSAAAQAGLAPHDVVTSFGGKMIGSQQDVRDVISTHKPRDQVTMQFIHHGKTTEKKVTLGARPAHLKRANGKQRLNKRWMFKGLGAQVPPDEQERMQNQMKEHVERLRKQFKENGGGVEDENGAKIEAAEGKLNAAPAPKGQVMKFEFKMNSATSVTMSDADGSATLKTRNGKTEVTVKDKQGEIIFEGPYNTPQDKASLPDDIRKRVESLNLKKTAIHLNVNPKELIPPPAANEDEDAQ